METKSRYEVVADLEAQKRDLIIREKGIENYKETIGKIMNYFHFMDDKYYSELEGKQDDMMNLTKLLDKKEI